MHPGTRPVAIRILGTHYTWNDEAEARDALYAAEQSTMDGWRRAFPRVRLWWTDETADAVIAAAAGVHASLVDDDLPARIVGFERTWKAERSATTRKYAALTAALFARAIQSGVLAAHHVDPAALCSRISAAIAEQPEHGCGPTINAFTRAVLADATGADADGRVEQWRGVVEATAGGVMSVRHRHLARLSLAAALVECGERDEAATLLERIVVEAPPHGAARITRWAGELAERAGLAAGGPARDPGTDDLTQRERQVLQLIAQGLSNAQIGERLFISPKTVSVHVSAILAKTGAANRAEAAARFVEAARRP